MMYLKIFIINKHKRQHNNNKKRPMSSYQYVKIARFVLHCIKKRILIKKINHGGGTKNKNKKKENRRSVESATTYRDGAANPHPRIENLTRCPQDQLNIVINVARCQLKQEWGRSRPGSPPPHRRKWGGEDRGGVGGQ